MTSSFPDFSYEKQYQGVICGVDEAGRGPWAGPVVAAAVIITDSDAMPAGIHDSKKLTASTRNALLNDIQNNSEWCVGIATPEEIDNINILQATLLAMKRAVDGLPRKVDVALIDGNQLPKLDCAMECIKKGDSRSLSIAAASIIAKVTRDRMMAEAALTYPEYGFEKHAGYGTPQHQAALAQHGVTPLHRKSFKPIKLLLAQAEQAA